MDKQLNYLMATEQAKALRSVVSPFQDKFNLFS